MRPLHVGLYINDPKATILRHVRCLISWGMRFRSVWRGDLAALKPGDCDVLLLHGGWYGIDRVPAQNQGDVRATPENRRMAAAVRRFVREGGGVVGVCCGAFNVVWLGLIEAEISRACGAGMHALEVVDAKHPIAKPVLRRAEGRKDRRWQPVPCMRVNGPIFFPKNKRQMVFSYDWEQRLGAVLAGGYGRGRAVALSPHPEMTGNERDGTVSAEPLLPASGIYRAALLWAAGRKA
jgi:hypothetical protein